MSEHMFFKPTPLYKEFMILDLVDKNNRITQREMSDELGSSLSMINGYLDEYEAKGFLKREYTNSKSITYIITEAGVERKKVLNIGFLNSSQLVYQEAKRNVVSFLNQLVANEYKKIVLYGAGEVAEIILQVIKEEDSTGIEIVGVIDDNPEKQGSFIGNTKIIKLIEIEHYTFDGVFISTYSNRVKVLRKLKSIVDESKIIKYF